MRRRSHFCWYRVVAGGNKGYGESIKRTIEPLVKITIVMCLFFAYTSHIFEYLLLSEVLVGFGWVGLVIKVPLLHRYASIEGKIITKF